MVPPDSGTLFALKKMLSGFNIGGGALPLDAASISDAFAVQCVTCSMETANAS